MYKSIQNIIAELAKSPNLSDADINKILRANPSDIGKICSKSEILEFFNGSRGHFTHQQRQNFASNIIMKKTRTLSGVTTVTVLTKPFACPGKCIFCPNDVEMPKSYISSEPGAQRAESNNFDPYNQTYNRLLALDKIGHPTQKVEVIVLGGTWTAYPEEYQIWFIKRCFDALNDFIPGKSDRTSLKSSAVKIAKEVKNELGVINYNISVSLLAQSREKAKWEELFAVQKLNENALSRCVGLVIETRPDEIDEKEVVRIRKLGATKVQIGVQSLNDRVLALNKRGHDSKQTALAFSSLRRAGFKIQAHYMPNLYGSTPKTDISDFKKLFTDKRFCPDELKIYPCSLIGGTQLMHIYKQGKWKPYTYEELLYVLTEILKNVPRYCRVTRMIRDIPSQEIVEGNKVTNLRQYVEDLLASKKIKLKEIRSREIKNKKVSYKNLKLKVTKYETASSKEQFIEFISDQDQIVGFLRLSLLKQKAFIKELESCAIIREVHVYGESMIIGANKLGVAQHIGLGTNLVENAIKISKKLGFKKIAVISSIGTKKYYERFGFKQVGLYQILEA